jgi:hypothetical protein
MRCKGWLAANRGFHTPHDHFLREPVAQDWSYPWSICRKSKRMSFATKMHVAFGKDWPVSGGGRTGFGGIRASNISRRLT